MTEIDDNNYFTKMFDLRVKELIPSSCEMIYSMRVKWNFSYVPVVQQVDNTPLKNAPHSQNFGENSMFIYFIN